MKQKHPRKGLPKPQQTPWRALVGGAVVLAVIVIVIVKVGAKPPNPPAIAVELPTVVVAVGAPQMEVSVATPLGGVGTPTQPVASVTTLPAEPWPDTPAAQVGYIVRNHKPAMVLFHSTNCIPCKAMEKLVGQVRGDYEPEIAFIDVITSDSANNELLRQAQIRAIPTSFFFSVQGQSTRVVGAMKEDVLRSTLNGLLVGGK